MVRCTLWSKNTFISKFRGYSSKVVHPLLTTDSCIFRSPDILYFVLSFIHGLHIMHVARQSGDANSSWVPGLTSDFQRVINALSWCSIAGATDSDITSVLPYHRFHLIDHAIWPYHQSPLWFCLYPFTFESHVKCSTILHVGRRANTCNAFVLSVQRSGRRDRLFSVPFQKWFSNQHLTSAFSICHVDSFSVFRCFLVVPWNMMIHCCFSNSKTLTCARVQRHDKEKLFHWPTL